MLAKPSCWESMLAGPEGSAVLLHYKVGNGFLAWAVGVQVLAGMEKGGQQVGSRRLPSPAITRGRLARSTFPDFPRRKNLADLGNVFQLCDLGPFFPLLRIRLIPL